MRRAPQTDRSAAPGLRTDGGGASGLVVLAARLVLGGYLAAHGAQKLFGAFGGPGIGPTVAGFDRLGLRPAPVMARVAALSELGGGVLTAAGAAHPVGPVALAGTMAVASATHRAKGAFAAKGGFELPLTNAAAAMVLAVAGPGRYSLDGLTGRSLPKPLARLMAAGVAASAGACVAMLLRAAAVASASARADAAADGETGASTEGPPSHVPPTPSSLSVPYREGSAGGHRAAEVGPP